MEATVTSLGELGRNKKAKKPPKPKAKKLKLPKGQSQPAGDYNGIYAPSLFQAPSVFQTDSIGAPPPVFQPFYQPSPVVQEGHSTRDSILATINNGINAFINKGDGSSSSTGQFIGNEQRLTRGESDTAASAGAGLGKGLDQFGKTVTANPLLFGGIGIALLLLFMKPPSRRGR